MYAELRNILEDLQINYDEDSLQTLIDWETVGLPLVNQQSIKADRLPDFKPQKVNVLESVTLPKYPQLKERHHYGQQETIELEISNDEKEENKFTEVSTSKAQPTIKQTESTQAFKQTAPRTQRPKMDRPDIRRSVLRNQPIQRDNRPNTTFGRFSTLPRRG